MTKFSLTLFGGKKGLIEMSSGFCTAPKAEVKFTGQNGKVSNPSRRSRRSARRGRRPHGKKKAHGHNRLALPSVW